MTYVWLSTKNENYWNNGVYDWYTPSDVAANENIVSFSANKRISVLGLANSGAQNIEYTASPIKTSCY